MLSCSKKIHLNKSARFEVNRKSVYTSRDEGFDENSASTVRNSKNRRKLVNT